MIYSRGTHKRLWHKSDLHRCNRITRNNIRKAADKCNRDGNAIRARNTLREVCSLGVSRLDIAMAFVAAIGIGLYNGSWAMGFWTFIFMMAIFIIAFEEKDKLD